MKFRKLYSLVLLIIYLLSMFGCGSKGGNNTGEFNITFSDGELPNAVETVDDKAEHLVATTLHELNITESDNPFIVNGQTDYKIVKIDDIRAGEAAQYIANIIEENTGASIEILSSSSINSWTLSDRYIVLGDTELFDQAGLTMPQVELGTEGYYIKTKGNSVFIMPNYSFGYSYATMAFLRAVMGYEVFSADTYICSKDGSTIPSMDIVEKPDFTLRYGGDDANLRFAWGGQSEAEIFATVDGASAHNGFKWLPRETYQSANPEWYAPSNDQLCYTARGVEEKYNLMIDTIMVKMKDLLDSNPDVRSVSITMQDNGSFCSCDKCWDNYKKYKSHAASVLMFMNDVGEKVDEYLTQQAQESGKQKREFQIVFFAYMSYESAPTKKLDNGEYAPIDNNVVCRDNVSVYYAPINAKYVKSFYELDNSVYLETLKAWSACCDKVYLWLYETNFANYLYPYPTYEACLETFRACAKYSPYMIRCQNQGQRGVTCFGAFKDYLSAKGQFDANVKYSDCVENFFSNYFGDASQYMLQYFYEVVAHYENLLETASSYVTGNIYEQISQPDFWPKKKLDHWMDLINNAYESIEIYKLADPIYYTKLYNHINLESIFVRFVLLENYTGYYNSNQLLLEQKAFKNDCQKHGVNFYCEGGSISAIWSKWGV